MKKISGIIFCLAVITSIPSGANAEGCDAYPYTAGEIMVVSTPKGPKILATGFAEVDFDETAEVLEATTEATMEAKAIIAKFFNEDIKSETEVNKVITKSIKISNGKELKTKDSIKTTLKRLSNSASALLRGVQTLASCYTKGEIMMVTVGLKPETVAAAESGAQLISESVNRQPTTPKTNDGNKTGQDHGSSGAPTGGTKSYVRGVKNLKTF